MNQKIPSEAQPGTVENFNPNEPVVVKDKTGRSHVLTVDDGTEVWNAETLYKVAHNDYVEKHLDKLKEERQSAAQDVSKAETTIKAGLIESKRLTEDSESKTIDVNGATIKNFANLQRWAQNNPDLIVEVANNSDAGVFKRKETDWVHQSEVYLETASGEDDDRTIGIPHTMTTAGDKIYIINGRVMTGWSMYFSLTAIKSPEDYAKNVDLAFNVPYLYSSLILKAQLGLGARYDLNFGNEDEKKIPEELFIENLHFKKLKLTRRRRLKTAFHKYTYGNSYWHLKRDDKGLPEKITILQPERIKIFLDPMTTKIMFYIYLPPIIGGTVLTPYPMSKENPNLMHNMALTYPIPIVIRPEDIIHFKQNDFTEYPFGFSDVRACLDPAQARLDINLLAPIIFKKYAKPMVHWSLKISSADGLPPLHPKQIENKISDMVTQLQNIEPGSDPVTTERWTPTVLNAPSGNQDLLVLTNDLDAQVFAVNGVPETYFKPKGTTDRMVAEQDKTFMGRLEGDREDFVNDIEDKLIKEPIDMLIEQKRLVAQTEEAGQSVIMDELDKYLLKEDSFMASQPRYPEVQWREVMKQDETQEITNTLAMLAAGVISPERAAKKLNEEPPEDQADQELSNLMNNDASALDAQEMITKGLDTNKPFKSGAPGSPLDVSKGLP